MIRQKSRRLATVKRREQVSVSRKARAFLEGANACSLYGSQWFDIGTVFTGSIDGFDSRDPNIRVWLNPVERGVWGAEVVGSNPITLTTNDGVVHNFRPGRLPVTG